MEPITVTQLTSLIRSTLEQDRALGDVWVTGEVTDYFQSAAGHVYFRIKDTNTLIRAVLFRGNTGAEHVANGSQLNMHGRVSFYTVKGETQLNIDTVVPVGFGILAAEFERLYAKLESEGLFDQSRKRPLPTFPKSIGVVTSEHGAVIHDIVTVIARRYPLAHIVLFPASVQGEAAPLDISAGLRVLNAMPEVGVIIVGRGGGSAEDLWAFNTEEVARAIYGSHIPVISAVGHETDVTIADFVADLRAPTPSAAAEAVTPDKRELDSEIQQHVRRGQQVMNAVIAQSSIATDGLVSRLSRAVPDIPTERQRVDGLIEQGQAALFANLGSLGDQLAGLIGALNALNPAAVVARGFAIVTKSKTNQPITQVSDIATGDIVRIRVTDGSFESKVF